MKKQVSLAAVVSLMIFSGCENHKTVKPLPDIPSLSAARTSSGFVNNEAGKYVLAPLFFINAPGTEYGVTCLPTEYDCLKTITVTPSSRLQALDDAVANGNDAVAAFFNGTDYDQLFPYLAEEDYSRHLDSLQSGNYSLHKVLNLETGTAYYLAGQGTATADHYDWVMPLTITE